MNNLSHTAAIILAAGKGKRIGSHLPKVLYPLAGRPMVSYVLDTLISIGLKDIFVVTGFRSEDVQASINRRAYFVYQPTPLGTGHAVSCALKEIPPDIDTIIVTNGDDSSFYTPQTFEKIIASHKASNSVISIVTAEGDSPGGVGRIIRNETNEGVAIREEKEATDLERNVKEVNIGLYVFDADWVRLALSKIEPRPGQEIYLVDVIAMASAQQKKVNDIQLGETSEWRGVNTQEELEIANKQMVNKINSQSESGKVYIFDLDDTLLATDKLKEIIEEKAVHMLKNVFSTTLDDVGIKTLFWDTYAIHKNKNGWISMPELGEELAQAFKIEDGGPIFKRLLYTLPFEDFIKPGAREILTQISSLGKRVILAYGDLVYQPIKLSIFNNFIDTYQAYEKLTSTTISEIIELYGNSQIILIDDKLQNLADFKRSKSTITTVWIKDGPYKNDLVDGFNPDYEIQSILELKELLSKI